MHDEELVLDLIRPSLVVWVELFGNVIGSFQFDCEFDLAEVSRAGVFLACVDSSLEEGSVFGEDGAILALLLDGELGLTFLDHVLPGEIRLFKGNGVSIHAVDARFILTLTGVNIGEHGAGSSSSEVHICAAYPFNGFC